MTVGPHTRRKVLAASGSLAALGLAGCLGDDDDGNGNGNGDDDHDDHDDGHDDHDDGHDDHDHDDDHGDEVEDEEFDHIGIDEFEVLDRAHDPHEDVAYVHGDHWHGDLPQIPVGDNVSLGAYIEDEDGDEIELGPEYELGVRVADDAEEGIVAIDEDEDFHGDHVHIHGESEGETEVVFQLIHDDHVDYETPSIAVSVDDS